LNPQSKADVGQLVPVTSALGQEQTHALQQTAPSFAHLAGDGEQVALKNLSRII
jgi:hypothetical protein